VAEEISRAGAKRLQLANGAVSRANGSALRAVNHFAFKIKMWSRQNLYKVQKHF
jgi:hypothetical protein